MGDSLSTQSSFPERRDKRLVVSKRELVSTTADDVGGTDLFLFIIGQPRRETDTLGKSSHLGFNTTTLPRPTAHTVLLGRVRDAFTKWALGRSNGPSRRTVFFVQSNIHPSHSDFSTYHTARAYLPFPLLAAAA